ncbi:MAG: D-aminoacyl-tRNA deacylase [Thermotogaceae bacterium]|nr:D-aminoacyl-tRNA deacylase [Thermotogaceae bacterium]MDN5338390.1 D-aminoacyl-tRNA deacylase [Thermotogaceae bacterium]
MRAVLQRVKTSKVTVDSKVVGQISKGIMALIGVGRNDSFDDIKWLAEKIVNLRIFEDENGKMNLSLLDVKGELLLVSQFTLFGDCRRGRRPSFTDAAEPSLARELFERFVEYVRDTYPVRVETGVFQEHMEVELINDGPVTLLLDSKKTF